MALFIWHSGKAEWQKCRTEQWLSGLVGEEMMTTRGLNEDIFYSNGTVLYDTVVADTWLHGFAKTHRAVHHEEWKQVYCLQIFVKTQPECQDSLEQNEDCDKSV